MCITTLRQKIHNRLTYVLVPGVFSKLPMMHSLFTFSFKRFLKTVHSFFNSLLEYFLMWLSLDQLSFSPKVWTSRFWSSTTGSAVSSQCMDQQIANLSRPLV
jgi:hypothetical protein